MVVLGRPGLGCAHGVLYGYFRASDPSTAVAVLEWVGGPPAGSDAPVLDAVDGCGIDPMVMMVTLQSLLTGTIAVQHSRNGAMG